MEKYYPIFVRKQITFKGTQEELELYNNKNDYPFDMEENLDNIINKFIEFCNNNVADKHYMVSKIGQQKSLALLWNVTNKKNPYIMIYDENTDTRLYSVLLNNVSELRNENAVKIIKYIPEMCKFSERMIEKQQSKDIWILDDLQAFADAIDKYNMDYD